MARNARQNPTGAETGRIDTALSLQLRLQDSESSGPSRTDFSRLFGADPEPGMLLRRSGALMSVEEANPAAQRWLKEFSGSAPGTLRQLAAAIGAALPEVDATGAATFHCQLAAAGERPGCEARLHQAGPPGTYVLRLPAQLTEPAAEENFSQIFLRNPALTLLLDPESGRLVQVSPALAAYYGYSPAEMLDMHISTINCEPLEVIQAAMAEAKASNGCELEFRHRLRDGRIRVMHIYTGPVTWQGRLLMHATLLDVTEQREAEQALRESEGRLQEIVSTMNEGLLVIDQDRRILFGNQSAARILDLQPEALAGQNLLDFAPPDQFERMDRQREIRQRGQPSSYELDLLRPDGERRTLLVHSTPRPFMGGAFQGAYLILHDLTETRRMQRELEESQVRLSALLEQLKDVVIYETGPGVQFISSSLGEILGYSPAEMARFSSDFAVLTHPQDHAQYELAEADWRARGAPGVLVLELRWRHKEGHWVWLEDRMVLEELPGGRVLRRGVMIDISARKEIEGAIEASEGRYRELMERTSDAVLRTGPDGTIIYANPVARKLLSLMPGMSILEAASTLAGQEKMSSLLSNALALSRSRTPTWSFQLEMVDSSGEPRFMDWSCVFFYGGSGETLRTDFIGRDLTRQRRLMRQMLERQKDESIAAMAGGIAHDFNNILTSMLGSAGLLEAGVDSQTAHDLIGSIASGARQMAGLTSKLLAYAKSGPREIGPVNVNKAVADTLQMLRPLIGAEARLNAALTDEELHVLCGPTDINQIVLNLVVNAHEASPTDAGQIDVRIGSGRQEAWECHLHGQHEGGDYIRIEVSDAGCGIDEATISRIFEPYFTTKVQGRGLGLAAVAGIVTSGGGCIDVRSRPGAGTTFTVLLPRHREVRQLEAKVPADSNGQACLSGRILLVEDEDTVRFVAAKVLKRAGYEVQAVVDGQEALEAALAQGAQYDLILADAKMPRLGGIELAGKLAEAGSAVPLVLCTGFAPAVRQGGDTDGSGTGLPGVAGLLMKPYSSEELVAVAARFMAPARAVQAAGAAN